MSIPTAKVAGGTGHGYRPDIDGLRAIAVLSVIAFHCGVPLVGGGYVGVDIFFVISGYLICSLLYRNPEQSLSTFYLRRFKRIVPALAGVLAATFLVSCLVMSAAELQHFGKRLAAVAFSVANLYFAGESNYFIKASAHNPLLMTWSLAVEEQFYLCFPIILWSLRKRSRRTLLWSLVGLSLLSLGCSVALQSRSQTWNFYLPVTRAWELGCGAILAVLQSGRMKSLTGRAADEALAATGILLLIGSICFYKPTTIFPGITALPPVIGTAFLLASEKSLVARLLQFKPFMYVGLLSYSLYLWHWPILSFFQLVSLRALTPGATVIAMVVATVFAALSYAFIERPFRSMKTVNKRASILAYSGLLVFFALLGVSCILLRGMPWRYPESSSVEAQAQIEREHPCITQGRPHTSEVCVPPVRAGVQSIALMGDSHAEALFPVMSDLARKRGVQLVTLTRGSCPPSIRSLVQGSKPRDFAECEAFNVAATEIVAKRTDVKTVFLTALWSGSYLPHDYLKSGLNNEVSLLKASGKEVILIQDVPGLPFDPVMAERNQYIEPRSLLARLVVGGEKASVPRIDAAVPEPARSREALESLAAVGNVNGLSPIRDPFQIFCRDAQCVYGSHDTLYYADEAHLSATGSQLLLPMLNTAF